MAIDTKFLKTINYFKGLSDAELNLIRPFLSEKKYGRGDIIIYEGDAAKAVYFILAGAVKLFKTSVEGKDQILYIARPGDSFNDVAVFDSGNNPASAQAMGEVTVFELVKSELTRLLNDNPHIASNTIRVLAEQIRQLVTLVEDLSFRNVLGRVAKILLQYAHEEAGAGPKLTQQEMAAMAGSAREVVGRSLKALEENGMIKLNRQKVLITDIEALREMVEEPV
jgi:CRP/FNR family transcriptional regulator